MIVVSTDDVPGRRIARTVGMVRGNTVRSRHIGRDIGAWFKGLVGGEIEEYTKLIAESREQAIDRMIVDAQEKGADAVVGIRFATCEISGHAAEFMAYGTGVVFET